MSITQIIQGFRFGEQHNGAPDCIPLEERTHSVVLLHGIRTRARWYRDVGKLIQENCRDVRVSKPKYGKFGLKKFVTNDDAEPLRVVKDTIRAESKKPQVDKVSVIAHSFGSYLITRALLEEKDICLHKLILCGSVVPENFQWREICAQIGPHDGRDHIYNEYSEKDIWPRVASKLSSKYGNAGSFGFEDDSRVSNRQHDGRHSFCLTQKFAEENWLPLLS